MDLAPLVEWLSRGYKRIVRGRVVKTLMCEVRCEGGVTLKAWIPRADPTIDTLMDDDRMDYLRCNVSVREIATLVASDTLPPDERWTFCGEPEIDAPDL